MKKLIGILAVGLVVLGFLTGCVQKPAEEESRDPQAMAVMAGGKLYFDSGQKIGVARCGVMDGYITDSVEVWQLPEKDGRSNFGTGYSWQLVDRHHIDIPMDNPAGWSRFCDGECDSDHSENLGENDDICGYPLKEDMDICVEGSRPFQAAENQSNYPDEGIHWPNQPIDVPVGN